MPSKWRRFELLIPLEFNDGVAVPEEWLIEIVSEVVDQFDAASLERQPIEGRWQHGGALYRDSLDKLGVDVRDTSQNRLWMKSFKERWKIRLKQIDLWLVSYHVIIE